MRFPSWILFQPPIVAVHDHASDPQARAALWLIHDLYLEALAV